MVMQQGQDRVGVAGGLLINENAMLGRGKGVEDLGDRRNDLVDGVGDWDTPLQWGSP